MRLHSQSTKTSLKVLCKPRSQAFHATTAVLYRKQDRGLPWNEPCLCSECTLHCTVVPLSLFTMCTHHQNLKIKTACSWTCCLLHCSKPPCLCGCHNRTPRLYTQVITMNTTISHVATPPVHLLHVYWKFTCSLKPNVEVPTYLQNS